MKVRWSEQAALELAETAAYVARKFGKQSALKLRNTIDEAIGYIAQFPMIGVSSFIDEVTGVEFRELVCRLNSVIYTIYREEIFIVSIWSNRQDRDKLYSALRQTANEIK